MDKIIVLMGYAKSGKDFTCQRLQEAMPDYNFKRFALADFLKELMCIVLDMTREDMEEWKNHDTANRQRLIDFSEKGIKQVDTCFWVKKFGVDYLKNRGNYIITDARYYEEYYYLKEFAAKNPNTLKIIFVYVNRVHEDESLNVNGIHPDVYT